MKSDTSTCISVGVHMGLSYQTFECLFLCLLSFVLEHVLHEETVKQPMGQITVEGCLFASSLFYMHTRHTLWVDL